MRPHRKGVDWIRTEGIGGERNGLDRPSFRRPHRSGKEWIGMERTVAEGTGSDRMAMDRTGVFFKPRENER